MTKLTTHLKNYEIRRAHPDEAAALAALLVASKASWGYSQALMQLWAEELAISSSYIRRHATYVAERVSDAGVDLLGFCSFMGEGKTQELDNLFIAPEFQGQGVGRALFEFAMDQMQRRGARTVRIVSDPNAANFYRHFGARQIGQLPSRPEGRSLPIFLLEVEAFKRSG